MKLTFENDFQKKFMIQTFEDDVVFDGKKSLLTWKSKWLEALSKWHSPYKCIVHLPKVGGFAEEAAKEEFHNEAKKLIQFFKGFFLIKIVGVYKSENIDEIRELFPFEVVENFEMACEKAGYRLQKLSKAAATLREQIKIENHFRQQVVEMSFDPNTVIQKKSDIAIVKAKLTNNLMQWHSPWNLLIDFDNLEVSEGLEEEINSLIRYLKGFFLKSVTGYGIKGDLTYIPFKIYKSRHKAVALLEREGNFSSDEANCSSRGKA